MAQNEKIKFNAGTSSREKLLNSQIAQNNAETLTINSSTQYQTHKYALAALMGLTIEDLSDNIILPETNLEDDSLSSLGVDFYINMAINHRSDLQASKEALKSSKYNLYKSWGTLAPTLNLTIGYGYKNTEEVDKTLSMKGAGPSKKSCEFNYNLTTSWLIWDGGSSIAEIYLNNAKYNSAKESVASTTIDVIQNIKTNYSQLISNVAIAKINKKTMLIAQEKYDFAQKNYNAGIINMLDLQEAQHSFIIAEVAYIISIINVANYKAILEASYSIK